VPAAIHITPEAAAGGAIGRIQDGDVISLNVASGELFLNIDEEVLASRSTADQPSPINTVGRGLFLLNREAVTDAECGGCSLFGPPILDPVPVLETPRAVAYEHCAS
jgi:phosphogluconate dehydratase